MANPMRRVYASQSAEYALFPDMTAVAIALANFRTAAMMESVRDNQALPPPKVKFDHQNNRLAVRVDAFCQNGHPYDFTLAELVQIDSEGTLVLKVHAHPLVAIPSEGLHNIVDTYGITSNLSALSRNR